MQERAKKGNKCRVFQCLLPTSALAGLYSHGSVIIRKPLLSETIDSDVTASTKLWVCGVVELRLATDDAYSWAGQA